MRLPERDLLLGARGGLFKTKREERPLESLVEKRMHPLNELDIDWNDDLYMRLIENR